VLGRLVRFQLDAQQFIHDCSSSHLAPAKKQILFDATKLKDTDEKDNFDLTSMKLALDDTNNDRLEHTGTSEPAAFHVSTSFINKYSTTKVGLNHHCQRAKI
jgi:hypothetical protein